MKPSYDAIDIQILAILQQNTDGTAQDVAEQVGISTNACWRRMRALQTNGVIMNRVALLHPRFLGCGLTIFARAEQIAGKVPPPEQLERRAAKIAALSELHRIAGSTCFRLKLRASDLADYDRVSTLIAEQLGLRIIEAEFSIEQVKYSTQIPLPPVEE